MPLSQGWKTEVGGEGEPGKHSQSEFLMWVNIGMSASELKYPKFHPRVDLTSGQPSTPQTSALATLQELVPETKLDSATGLCKSEDVGYMGRLTQSMRCCTLSSVRWTCKEKQAWCPVHSGQNIRAKKNVKVSVTQLCPTVCDPMGYSLPGSSVHGTPGKNTGRGRHSLLQGIFLT